MKVPFKILSTLCFLLCFYNSYAQKQGLAAIDSMKSQLKGMKQVDTNKIKVIYRISDVYKDIDADSAILYARTGLQLAKNAKWDKAIAALYDGIGSILSNNGKYQEALKYYNTSLKINHRIGNKRNEVANILNIGSVYQRQGFDSQSLEYNFKALKLAEGIKNNDYLIGMLYANIANSYFSQSNLEMCLSYNFKAYKKYQDLKETKGIAEVTKNIGNVYGQQHKDKLANDFYLRSLQLYKSIDDKTGEAIILSQIGLLYENEKDKKLEYLIRAQQIFDKLNPLHSNSITNLGNIGGTYADIYIHKGLVSGKVYKYIPFDYSIILSRAVNYLKRAITYSKDVGDEDNFSYFSGVLAILQEKMGDYKSALSNYRLSQDINDSLYSQESKNKIAALEAQYNFRKKEDEYKQKQQLSSIRVRQLYLYGALIIVVISSVLIYLLDRSRISQLRLKNELQRREAAEKTKELMHINKLSESELKAIRAQMNPHFIFNVLNSIESYIVENDSKTASRLVQKFASLSRLILENSTQSMVTAEREWKALKLYTELEAMRFNNQFSYTFYVDPLIDLSTLLLPPMLVQPLIENSIHHGLRNSALQDNMISIKFEQTTSHIQFTVDDNGIGIDEAEKNKTFSAIKGKSIGLSAIRERIEIFNVLNQNTPASFEIRKKAGIEGKGTIAKLILPKVIRN